MGRAVPRMLRCTIRACIVLLVLPPRRISRVAARRRSFPAHSPVRLRSSRHDVENGTAAAVLVVAAAAVGDDARARRAAAAGEQFAGRVRDMAAFEAAGHAAERIAERGAVKRAAMTAAGGSPSKVWTATSAARRGSLWKRALDAVTPRGLRRTTKATAGAVGASGWGAARAITSRAPSKTAGLFTRVGAAGERTAAAGAVARSATRKTGVAVARGAGAGVGAAGVARRGTAAGAAAAGAGGIGRRSAGRAAAGGTAAGGLKRAAESAVTGAARRTALRGSGGGAAGRAAVRASYRSGQAAGSGAGRAALRGAVARPAAGAARMGRMRMGRRALAAVPLVGCLFAVHGCLQDRNRCVAEYEGSTLGSPTNAPNGGAAGGLACAAGMLFGFATLSGAVDVIAHAYIALALLAGWTARGHIAAAERVSFWVAVASMVLAVGGELSSDRRRREREG